MIGSSLNEQVRPDVVSGAACELGNVLQVHVEEYQVVIPQRDRCAAFFFVSIMEH